MSDSLPPEYEGVHFAQITDEYEHPVPGQSSVTTRTMSPLCGVPWVRGQMAMSISDRYITCEACLAKMGGRDVL